MDETRTINSRRRDLELLEVNAPFNYIGQKVYPVLTRADKSGTLFYRTALSLAGTNTGRGDDGKVIRNTFASASTTYSVSEKIFRTATLLSEVPSEGGIEESDRHGGELAKLGCMALIEKAQAAKLLTASTTHNVTAGKFLNACAKGAAAVRRVSGQTALVCSEYVYRLIIQSTEITNRLKFSGFRFESPDEVLSVKPEVLKSMLQQICQVDEILVGDPECWEQTNLIGRAAIVKLPTAEPYDYKRLPQYGRTIVNALGDSDTQFELSSHYNDDYMSNDYTARGLVDVIELNTVGKFIMTGFSSWDGWADIAGDDSSSSSSSSSASA